MLVIVNNNNSLPYRGVKLYFNAFYGIMGVSIWR